ncbi:MAG: hypothetical protein ACD_34C00098G0001, partial [uncultured bacterium]
MLMSSTIVLAISEQGFVRESDSR